MFTILIRYKDGPQKGREVLYTATTIEFMADDGLQFHCSDGGGMHIPVARPGSVEDYRDVFVMNSGGQTVARYNL